ncbi:MAG: pyruvate dehydrogenase complex dihydrolipoamide acetyltransferase [Alphaproteobacteria bacterium]|nr:pyruvate dehydrogenase complex dihydrolipoamide acetyltransferase [Alphaproteobacteria bacterium]
MPTQILMPALSPTMTEGNLAKWIKKEGDTVKAGQVIAEIETDKATMEVEAVDEGKIVKILIPAGTQGIKVNTPIAVLAEEGETVDVAKLSPANAPSESRHPGASRDPAVATPAASGALTREQLPMDPGLRRDDARIVASPLAKRIAEQSGVDLKTISGTGPNGRIVKADVEGAGKTAPAAAPRATTAAAPAQGVDAQDYADKLGMAYDAIPNSGVRKVIARRLTESKQLVPHFYLSVDIELDALLELRKHLNEASGAKISVNDCVIRATALAMKKIPASNASWTDNAILQYKDADVSVAVATPNGLITPIIKKADTKSLAQISREMKDLAARARDGKLRPEEFQGGGFSVSNLGMFGVKSFSAIINPPQSCILAVGAGEQRAVVKDGAIKVATVMTCTLSVDHRAVDGSVGAEFLQAFKPLIEKPYGLVV